MDHKPKFRQCHRSDKTLRPQLCRHHVTPYRVGKMIISLYWFPVTDILPEVSELWAI